LRITPIESFCILASPFVSTISKKHLKVPLIQYNDRYNVNKEMTIKKGEKI